MTNRFECGDNPALVGYLYDECAPDERAAIEAHVSICAACAAEVAALASTRTVLASWAPPEAELGFQIVRAQGSGPRAQSDVAEARAPRPEPFVPSAPWWKSPMPAWAQLAAAVVIFAAGLSLGVSRGMLSGSPAQVATVTPQSQPAVAAGAVSADDLTALEQRLRAEMAQVRTATATPAAATQLSGGDARLIDQVRTLIAESEQRQLFRTTQLAADVETQRRFDLARIQQAIGQSEQTAVGELVRQGQAINNIIRVSSQQGR